MRQVYFCPQCRALIGVGDGFCSNCGTHLNWVILQTPPRPVRESCSSPYPDRQQVQQRQLPSGDKQPVFHQQQKMSKEISVVPQRNSPSTGGAVTPISTEISRLLSDFFNKQVQNNWPDSIDSAYFFVGRFQLPATTFTALNNSAISLSSSRVWYVVQHTWYLSVKKNVEKSWPLERWVKAMRIELDFSFTACMAGKWSEKMCPYLSL